MAAALGLKTVLHVDALSALRTADELERLLALCDADNVGLCLDTAELTIMGHEVVALYRRFHGRVWHVQFKDALAVDTLDEYRLQNAERALIAAGGERRIERWFGEMGTGLVDFPALLAAMLTVTLVATIAASAVWQQWRNLEVEGAERTRVQAAWLLLGGLDFSRQVLRQDARVGGPDSLSEPCR